MAIRKIDMAVLVNLHHGIGQRKAQDGGDFTGGGAKIELKSQRAGTKKRQNITRDGATTGEVKGQDKKVVFEIIERNVGRKTGIVLKLGHVPEVLIEEGILSRRQCGAGGVVKVAQRPRVEEHLDTLQVGRLTVLLRILGVVTRQSEM